MDDPNIMMEKYIQLMADKARGRDKKFNWETDTYGKVYCDDLDSFTDFETDFPAIVYNDASTSNQNVSSEPTVSIYNAIKADIDFHISFSDSEDEYFTFIYNKDSSTYKLIPINDLKPEPVNEHVEINTESCSENIDFKPMDSVICISNDATPVEFDENIKTNHDTSDIMDMINDQNVEHTISPTPPPDYPLMSYLSGRGMKPLESEPVLKSPNELDAS
ncbi:hypothetical protein Tco_1329799 [Tanacetum coccineum]